MISAKSSSKKVTKSLGFGFVPAETNIHFLVDVPRGDSAKVSIYERSKWDDGPQKIDPRFDVVKVQLSKQKWEQIQPVLAKEFNDRLRAKKFTLGKWAATKTPVHRLLGKEMMILAWAVADCDPSVIGTALKNWVGLRPEERWWLYTMTNASTGGVDDTTGWRKALRYALTENPIIDSSDQQRTLFSRLADEEL
jgi:hypothetical protein